MRRRATFRTYLAYQVPGWILVILVLAVLREVIDLSLAAAGALLGLWVLKDLALFPFLGGAYEGDARTAAERLIGEGGTAVQDLAPAGYVRVRGELWQAEVAGGGRPIPAGRPVTVTSARGSVLVVEAPA
jgi:membrane protein implicated in regulation of membrane protease activity